MQPLFIIFDLDGALIEEKSRVLISGVKIFVGGEKYFQNRKCSTGFT